MMTRRPWGEVVISPTTSASTSMMHQYYHPTQTSSATTWWPLKDLQNFSQCRNSWTSEENKRFEELLAEFDANTPDRWLKVAANIPGKSPRDVENHYKDLVEDVNQIEAGEFPCSPKNPSPLFSLDWENSNNCLAFDASKQAYCKRKGVDERKKGVPWTEDEHRRFLLGLRKYGKGDWRNISRDFVQTRTSTQVASHAQKYFLRLNSGVKDKRRSSIHDITTDNIAQSPSHPAALSPTTNSNPSAFSGQFSADPNQPGERASVFDPSSSGNMFMQSQFEAAQYRMN